MKLLPRPMIVRGVSLDEYTNDGKITVSLSSPRPENPEGGNVPNFGMEREFLSVRIRPSQAGKMPLVGQEVTATIRLNWEGEDI